MELTKAEKRFLLFCAQLNLGGESLKPYMTDLIEKLINKYRTLIVYDNGFINEFVKIHDNMFVIYKYENNRFIYKSRIKVDYVETWTEEKTA